MSPCENVLCLTTDWSYYACTCATQHNKVKTHGSESRGQEEVAIRDERVSYLHVALL